MALFTQTASTDLSRYAQISMIHIATTGTASVVNLRQGSASGTIVMQFQGAINTSQTIQFARPLRVATGCYIELVSGTVAAITVDVV